ncbi:MAG: hypothetical protein PVI78_04965 [Anaerolineales bacterium]|jgi:hypothetical protein
MDASIWRVSLQYTESGEVRHFASLGELVAFLEMLTSRAVDHNEEDAA